MSVKLLPGSLTPELNCVAPIYNDTRWGARPQHFTSGNAHDSAWLGREEGPGQPPYYETDTPLMSYDLDMWKNPQTGDFRPEVLSSPCAPMATKYCSFGKPVYEYGHYPSMTIPTQPCTYRGRTTVPDIACLDQQELEPRDRLTYFKNLIQNM